MIRGIHHVAVHVHDLERMTRFYGEAFGFDRVGSPFSWQGSEMLDQLIDVPNSAARGLLLKCGNCYLELFQFEAPQPNSDVPLRPFDKGYTHFCVDVTDIEQECERLQSLGMTFGHTPLDFGHVKSIYGRDPEGNIIELQQTTERCDYQLDELIAARAARL